MLKLRWPAHCSVCSCALPAGTRARWDFDTRAVTCLACVARSLSAEATDPSAEAADLSAMAADPVPALSDNRHEAPLDPGRPGASATREYHRRRGNREARVRRRHPYLGPLLLAFSGSPQHERAFQRGGFGEETVARALERRIAKGPTRLLHDRRMPGGLGNIDHLAVAPRGVYVIDAKAIKGKVRVRRGASRNPKLQINGRTHNKLVAGLERQVLAVRAALEEDGQPEVSVTGALCFTEADFPLFGRMQVGEYLLRHCRALGRELNAPGPLAVESIHALAHRLGEQFPPA